MAKWEPDLKYITDLKQELETYYAPRNELIDEMREMRFLEDDFKIPEAYEATTVKIKTGLPMMWVQREVGALTTLMFSVRVPPPPHASQIDRENGSAVERFLPAMWSHQETQQKRDIYRNLIDAMVADGGGWITARYKPKAWQGMPEQRELLEEEDEYTQEELDEYNVRMDKFVQAAPLPFAFRTVDATTMFPVWGEYGMDAVLEVSKRPLLHVQRMASPWGGLPITTDDDSTYEATVEICEYWDSKWMGLLVAKGESWELVGALEHKYGRIPYWYAPGEETGSSDPRFSSVSTLFKLRHTNSAINQLATIKFNSAHLIGMPSWQGKLSTWDDDGEGGEPKPRKFEVGKINVYDEDPILPMPIPPVSADVKETIGLLLGLSSETQMDDSAAGSDGFSGESGFLRALKTEQARTGYHQIINHAERELSDMLSWILEMIDRLKMRLWVEGKEGEAGLSLSSDQINGHYRVQVKIEPYNPVMDVARGTYASNQVERGLWSRRYALEFMGIGQPDQMEDEIATERMIAALDQQIIDAALARMGFGGPGEEPTVLLGPDEQPINQALAGSAGGRPLGSPGLPGAGAPLAGRANAAHVPTRP